MKIRKFGNTELEVSEIGFGAWGIGGPAMAGEHPIGWGDVDDEVSIKALRTAFDQGINFFDTADFYGLGHSEELIGRVFGPDPEVIIATKVGHKLGQNSVKLDYSKKHILEACDQSLKRLRRDHIDYYQLHSARIQHLEQGECIEAMERLKEQGKIRYWGISLNTFNPQPEAEFFFENNIGAGFQIVLNVINQIAVDLIKKASDRGYGIIARMPIQFGLLTGKITKETRFPENDHRHFRLTPEFLEEAVEALEDVWPYAEKYGITKTAFSLSFASNVEGVSTVIPGIKTPAQAIENTTDIIDIKDEDMKAIKELYREKLIKLVERMKELG